MDRSDLDEFVEILKLYYKNWDAPVITMLANQGATPFEILISTILSLRTRDEVTAASARRLFNVASTPESIIDAGEEKVRELIYPVAFYPTKAGRIVKISEIIAGRLKGVVPDTIDELLKLPGVGRKTANLVLVEGFGKKGICVDTHVHRISNRTGLVKTAGADETEFALRRILPEKHWVLYNELLVAFGQVICRPISPFCSRCPVSSMCMKVGVGSSR